MVAHQGYQIFVGALVNHFGCLRRYSSQHLAAHFAIRKIKQQFTSDDVAEAERRVEEALSEVRTVSHLLHPASLELLGLRSSILSFVEEFARRTGIRTSVDVPEPLPKFDDVTNTALFRIIQECLTNVYRHAKASTITIRIRFTSTEFRLEIVDDGCGFQSDAREGVGIRGMRERVRELGGTFQLLSGQNLGISVIAIIPLHHAA